eukprot:6180052-Pleurochrysis_carterae.AAC.1
MLWTQSQLRRRCERAGRRARAASRDEHVHLVEQRALLRARSGAARGEPDVGNTDARRKQHETDPHVRGKGLRRRAHEADGDARFRCKRIDGAASRCWCAPVPVALARLAAPVTVASVAVFKGSETEEI